MVASKGPCEIHWLKGVETHFIRLHQVIETIISSSYNPQVKNPYITPQQSTVGDLESVNLQFNPKLVNIG